MIHPHTELKFIDEKVGFGVIANKFIPKGTITWVLDKLDRRFSTAQYESFEPVYQEILETYAFRDAAGDYVLCWDIARFVNHSFKANCLTTSYNFELAIRDIEPGEQLTDDYGYLNLEKPFRGVDEGTKRKTVYPDDLLKYHKIWDSKLKAAFSKVLEVDQPLEMLFETMNWEHIRSIARGEREMDSILNCYYSQK